MNYLDYLGHFHPLLVHLPIGIVLFAGALMLYGRFARKEVVDAVSLAWLLGTVSALLACGAGWLLIQSGEYDSALVQVHQWTGLGTAGLCLLTYLVKSYRWLPATATIILLMVAGHYGGSLTHGEDYLSLQSRKEPKYVAEASEPAFKELIAQRTDSAAAGTQPGVRRTFLYRDQVVPILETNCYSCHSARKKKGGLRLDSEFFIRKGGKNGSILLAGNPQKSKLFSYLVLPHDDELHMPPKGKRPLSPQDIALIHHWIKKGASFQEEIEIIAPGAEPQAGIIPVVIPSATGVVLPDSVVQLRERLSTDSDPETNVLARPVNAPDPAILESLKQQQILVTKLTEGTGHLAANFVNVRNWQSGTIRQLDGIREQLVRLRLTDQPLTDDDIKPLTNFPNLTRLNLENTRITDEALTYLQALPNLEQLNLYGTAITDEGLASLARYPSLKILYVWGTQVTPAGVERLRRARPNLKIDTGGLRFARPDSSSTL